MAVLRPEVKRVKRPTTVKPNIGEEMKKVENIYQTDLFDPDKLFGKGAATSDANVRSSFTLSRPKLMEALHLLSVNVKQTRKNKYFVSIELVIRENGILLKNDWTEIVVPCEPVGFCRAEVYYQDLLDAVKRSLKRDVPFIVFDHSISVNGVLLSAKTHNYDPMKDVSRNAPTLEKVTAAAQQFTPYAPDDSKAFFSKDGTKGFSRNHIHTDTQMVLHYMEKYGVDYTDVYDFILSFLSTQKPKKL